MSLFTNLPESDILLTSNTLSDSSDPGSLNNSSIQIFEIIPLELVITIVDYLNDSDVMYLSNTLSDRINKEIIKGYISNDLFKLLIILNLKNKVKYSVILKMIIDYGGEYYYNVKVDYIRNNYSNKESELFFRLVLSSNYPKMMNTLKVVKYILSYDSAYILLTTLGKFGSIVTGYILSEDDNPFIRSVESYIENGTGTKPEFPNEVDFERVPSLIMFLYYLGLECTINETASYEIAKKMKEELSHVNVAAVSFLLQRIIKYVK